MRQINKRCIIFSVCKGIDEKRDNEATAEVIKRLTLNNIPFKLVQGCYCGVEAQSFLAEVGDLVKHHCVRSICEQYNQESFLFLDEDRNAKIVPIHHGISLRGKFIQVSEERAKAGLYYTKDLSTGLYYIIEWDE